MASTPRYSARITIDRYLDQQPDIRHVAGAEGEWSIWLPDMGQTNIQVDMRLGDYSLFFTSFFMRAPEENVEQVYRFLLRRNLDVPGARFGLNEAGDIFLSSELPISAITEEELDRHLGHLASLWTQSYGTVLRMGWAKHFQNDNGLH